MHSLPVSSAASLNFNIIFTDNDVEIQEIKGETKQNTGRTIGPIDVGFFHAWMSFLEQYNMDLYHEIFL